MLLTNYAIKFRTAVFVCIVAFCVIGFSSYRSMPREGAPDVTIPYVFVTAPYEGVAPSEIENLIAIPMEKQFNDLENVKDVISTSTEGLAIISIEFTPREDINNALQRVKDKIDLARIDLPRDLDEPIVQVINFSTDMPILTLAFAGDMDLERLKILAEDLKDRIENLSGVKAATIYGSREREIRVEIDPKRLAAYHLPVGAVIMAIAQENKTLSAGNLEMTGGKFQVRVPGEFKLVSEMKDIVVSVRNGQSVYLTDVANITDTFKDQTTISRINGKPCVSVQVKKRSGENSVRIAEQVKEILKTFSLPPGIEIIVTNDQSTFIKSMVAELENSIATGFLLVISVLFLFLGWRNSIFVGLAIPISCAIAFVILNSMNFTLNMMVLFSLVMAVGMVVDDAIVIVENSYRNRALGYSTLEAAKRGASEVAWPVTTSTLTTLAAFWPLLLWPDIMGQFMSFLPKTLIILLSASLFVALALNPAVCSVFISVKQTRKHHRADHPFLTHYEKFLRGAIAHRGVIMAIGLSFLVLTMLLYARFGRGMELFPDVEPRNASIQVKYPQGTNIEKTDQTLAEIEKLLPQFEDIKFYLTTVGAPGGMSFSASQEATHVGNIYVEFLDAKERKGNTLQLIDKIRKAIPMYSGAEIKVEREKEGPPTGAPVSIEITGDDFDILSSLSAQIIRSINTVPGLVDLRDDYEEARPEFQIQINRKRAALLGLDTGQIGDFLRTSIYGFESSKFRAGEDEYDITVRLPENARNSADMLDQILIPLPNGQNVPLSSLGKIAYTGGRGDITRKNRKRVITVTGDITGRSIDAILADVRARVSKIPLTPGYNVTYTGENKEMKDSGAFLMKAFGIAVSLIAVILVVEFNSIVLPLIILFSVILSMIGVMLGLLICHMRFGVIMTGIGVISLAGVVVKNSIVLIDCTIQRRKEGMTAVDAVVIAGRQRLRPVLLTAGCTVLGLIPMVLGWSLEVHTFPWKLTAGAESGDWWAPMAIAVIFGLTLATVLTLVQVPIMYTLAEDLTGTIRRWFRRKDQGSGTPDSSGI